jgi:hypothetical protein
MRGTIFKIWKVNNMNAAVLTKSVVKTGGYLTYDAHCAGVKRPVKSPLRYPGGKSRAASYIINNYIIDPAIIIWTYENCRNNVILCIIKNYKFIFFLFVIITIAGSVKRRKPSAPRLSAAVLSNSSQIPPAKPVA